MKTALESLQEMTDVNTIIGDPIETPDGNVILTVSKVGFGFAAGGSEFTGGQSGGSHDSSGDGGSGLPFGGGSGGGVSITPIAFLIVGPHGVKTIHLDNNTHIYEKILDIAPQAVEKIQKMLSGSKGNNKSQNEQQRDSRNTVRRKGSQDQDDFF